MPKASEVAAELRRLAESLEKEPEAEIVKADVDFRYDDNKPAFLKTSLVLMPSPRNKRISLATMEPKYQRYEVFHENKALRVSTSIPRSIICRVIKPAQAAVYECEPLLSEAEEAQIGGAA